MSEQPRKVNFRSAPATVREIERAIQAVLDDPELSNLTKARAVFQAAHESGQLRIWDERNRLKTLAESQRVLVDEIMRLRAAQGGEDGGILPLALPAAAPLAGLDADAPLPVPVPAKRGPGRPRKITTIDPVELARAFLPIPPAHVYTQMQEQHLQSAADAIEAEDADAAYSADEIAEAEAEEKRRKGGRPRTANGPFLAPYELVRTPAEKEARLVSCRAASMASKKRKADEKLTADIAEANASGISLNELKHQRAVATGKKAAQTYAQRNTH